MQSTQLVILPSNWSFASSELRGRGVRECGRCLCLAAVRAAARVRAQTEPPMPCVCHAPHTVRLHATTPYSTTHAHPSQSHHAHIFLAYLKQATWAARPWR